MTPTIFAEANHKADAVRISTGEKTALPYHQEYESECGNPECFIHARYKTTICFQATDDEIVEFLSNKGKIFITFESQAPQSLGHISPFKPEMKCL